jgi:hypothetical protein
MNRSTIIASALLISLIFLSCERPSQDNDHMMNDEQMGQMMQDSQNRQAMMSQMMQNPESRQAMMARMAQDPEMRMEMMQQMQSRMGEMDQSQMMDRMEIIMNDSAQRRHMISHMQQILQVLEEGDLNREQMEQMMENSPMAALQIRCMMMTDNN